MQNAVKEKGHISVGADSLRRSTRTCSAIALWVSQVPIPAHGPYLIPPCLPLSLPLHFLSTNGSIKIKVELNI